MAQTFDIQAVVAIARQAGAEIMAMRPEVVANPEIKGDGSPVTKADKRASAIVIEGMHTLTPHIPVASEENPDGVNRAIQASHDTYWIVDPLDGTVSYINGYDGFGVHIGLIDKGVPVAGVIFFPALDVVYYTDNGRAYRQETGKSPQEIRVNAPAQAGKPLSAAVSWKKHRQPQGVRPVEAVGGARIVITAEGQTDIAVIEGSFNYWDVAASHALLRAAGGELFALDTGAAIRYPSDKLFIPRAIGGHADVVSTARARVLDAVNQLKRPVVPKP